MNWTSNNASYCNASGAWSGTKSTSGTYSVSPSYGSSTYTLTCYGSGGSTSCSTYINVGSTGTPNLRINKLVRNITNATGFYDSVNAKSGDELEFSIELNSVGNRDVGNVRVWDSLPSGLDYISGSTTLDGSYRGDGITSGGIYIGTMSAGTNRTVKFRAKVSSSISGASGIITIDAGNQNIQTSGNISVSKMGRNVTQNQSVWSYTIPAYYGDTLEFSIQLTNNSGSTVNNITIKESLPSNLSLVSNSTIVDGSYWNGDITGAGINLGTMTYGQVKTVKFRATVVGGTYNTASATLNNIAYANADNVSQINDQASVVISGQSSGEVLGASVVTGIGLTPFLFVLAIISLVVAFFVYCSTRESKVLDYLSKEKGNKFLKLLIGLYFKAKLRFRLAVVRFKQVYL